MAHQHHADLATEDRDVDESRFIVGGEADGLGDAPAATSGGVCLSGSNPQPATAGQAWYLAALAFDSDPSTRRSACKCD